MGIQARYTSWWNTFPSQLKKIAIVRLIFRIGVGSVVFLTPVVFNKQGFSAIDISLGISIAAISGITAQSISGKLIDRGFSYIYILYYALSLSIAADIIFYHSNTLSQYIQAQIIAGFGMGIYSPASKYAIPEAAGNYNLGSAYSFCFTLEALGIFIGTSIGSILSAIIHPKSIYIFELMSMILAVFAIYSFSKKMPPTPRQTLYELTRYTLSPSRSITGLPNINRSFINFGLRILGIMHVLTFKVYPTFLSNWNKTISKKSRRWLIKLAPFLLFNFLMAAAITIIESALPLYLATGLSENGSSYDIRWVGVIISTQLAAVLVIQFPVGQYLSRKSFRYGLTLSAICFSSGAGLIWLDSLLNGSIWLLLLAQIAFAFAKSSYFPVASSALVACAPEEHRATTMAIYGQLFSSSKILCPILAGFLLEKRLGNMIWLSMSMMTILSIILIRISTSIHQSKQTT